MYPFTSFLEAEIGDMTPSQFMRHLKSICPNGTSDSMIKYLWLRRLPEQARIILIAVHDKSLDELGKAADAVLGVIEAPKKQEFKELLFQRQLDTLSDEVRKLRVAVEKLSQSHTVSDNKNSKKKGNNNKRNRKGKTPSVSHSSTSVNTDIQFCWYHFQYGENAYQCIPPCDFNSDSD